MISIYSSIDGTRAIVAATPDEGITVCFDENGVSLIEASKEKLLVLARMWIDEFKEEETNPDQEK